MQLGRQLQAGALLAASRMGALPKSWVDWANVHDLVDALAEPGVLVLLVVDIEDGRAGLAPVDLVGREAVWRLSGIAAAPTRHVEEELHPVLNFACHCHRDHLGVGKVVPAIEARRRAHAVSAAKRFGFLVRCATNAGFDVMAYDTGVDVMAVDVHPLADLDNERVIVLAWIVLILICIFLCWLWWGRRRLSVGWAGCAVSVGPGWDRFWDHPVPYIKSTSKINIKSMLLLLRLRFCHDPPDAL